MLLDDTLLNKKQELAYLAMYLHGMAVGADDHNLQKAANWLEELESRTCGQGYIGCNGGANCTSDHK